MKDSRDRQLGSGLSFRVRTCHGLFPASSLIDQAKGNQHDDQDDKGGDQIGAAYPTRLQSVHIGDMLVTA